MANEATTTTQIRDIFYDQIPIKVTPNLAQAVIKFVTVYENRDQHPQAFNTPYLGLAPCYFLTSDRDAFLSLFDVSYAELEGIIQQRSNDRDVVLGVNMKSILAPITQYVTSLFRDRNLLKGLNITNSEVRVAMKEITSINLNYKVAADPFNIFSAYASHVFVASNLPDKLKEEAAHRCLVLLSYKFFTSLVNHRFKYRPDEETMAATYESLSAKFDIKTYGTWKEVMSVRAYDFLDKKSIHRDALEKFTPDQKVLYIITDIQSRIRSQINLYTQEFMRIKETKDRIGGYTLVGTDPEGDKQIVDISSQYDTMIAGVYHDCLSVSHFLDDRLIRLVVKFFTSLTPSKLRSVLITFSEYAVKQAKSGQQILIRNEKGEETDIGAQAVISAIIQRTYRYLILSNVNIRDITNLIKSTKDVYSSSRVMDEGIVRVRRDMVYLIDQIGNSTREATITSLRTAFVIYIILLSFKYQKK